MELFVEIKFFPYPPNWGGHFAQGFVRDAVREILDDRPYECPPRGNRNQTRTVTLHAREDMDNLVFTTHAHWRDWIDGLKDIIRPIHKVLAEAGGPFAWPEPGDTYSIVDVSLSQELGAGHSWDTASRLAWLDPSPF